MARNSEKLKNEKYTLQDLNYDLKTEKRGKGDTNTVGPVKHSVGCEIWREILKNVKYEK